VHRAKLYTWKEYFDKIKNKDNQSWLTVLKYALEVFNGDCKGFARVSECKERREKELR